jgi:hypothetical protein
MPHATWSCTPEFDGECVLHRGDEKRNVVSLWAYLDASEGVDPTWLRRWEFWKHEEQVRENRRLGAQVFGVSEALDQVPDKEIGSTRGLRKLRYMLKVGTNP